MYVVEKKKTYKEQLTISVCLGKSNFNIAANKEAMCTS